MRVLFSTISLLILSSSAFALPTGVPEPETMLLLGVAAAAFLAVRKKK